MVSFIRISCGTTRFTIPIFRASSGVSTSPVSRSSRAFDTPVSLGRKYAPPSPGISPIIMYDSASFALSEHTLRSHMIAISIPAPIAAPLIAAITGLSRSSSVNTIRWTPSHKNLFISHDLSFPSAISRISPPEQNVSPFPVTTIALTLSSAFAFSRHSRHNFIISGLNAFFALGLFSVITAT